MATLQRIFGVLRAAAFLGIILLLLRSEYQFVHGNLMNALNPVIQIYAIVSAMILPLFWFLLVIALIGHFGKRTIRKRLARQDAGD